MATGTTKLSSYDLKKAYLALTKLGKQHVFKELDEVILYIAMELENRGKYTAQLKEEVSNV